MNDILLHVRNLRTWFHTFKGVVKAVDDVSFDMRQGEVLAVVGESGGGKSVTGFSVIRLIDEPGKIESGEIVFDGRDLMKLSEHEMNQLRGKDIAMIFQDPMTSLNPVYTIGQQMEETLLLHTNMNKEQRRKTCCDLLRAVGISNPESRLNSYPHQFSGGMRQRVVIAIALAVKPKLIIADEPTTALDVTIQAQILDLLKELEQEYHTSIVLITHDMGVVATVCSKIAIMYGGLIMENGMTDEIFYNPKHPYTKALLRAIPSLDLKEGERLQSIDGVPPSLIDPPVGCPFAERCEYATERCYKEMPKYKNYSETHRAMCFLNEQE